MSLYSRLDRLAADVEKLNKQVTAVSNQPQSQRTSVEGGSFDFNDADGNLMAVVGGQDDGSNTIRHVDGPTPPIPSGLSAHVDGPIVQVSWDGSFEDGVAATYDWSHLEVVAVGPSNEQLTATINDVTGASTNLAATSSGAWTVVARSVSRAEKRSLDGDAGTVDVKLVDIDGAIEAVQDSANGKNKVTYSEHPPTPADPGIFDDTWFVGQVGRPNDIVEAANLVFNPSFEIAPSDLSLASGLASAVQSTDSRGILKGSHCLSVTGASSGISINSAQFAVYTSHGVSAGEYLGWGWSLLDANAVGLTVSVGVNWYTSGGSFISSEYQSYRTVPTSLDMMSSAFLAPTGTYRARMIIRFRASDGSSPAPANFNVLSDGWLASPAASQSSALAAVATYFDGDTPSGATDNESHYRWTGTPHASTSEKYLPALTIGGSDNWNIIEQYRHDGTGWVKVELSHYVFSSVDLGKATVGELDGIRIAAQTIRGQQLSGDAIDGKVITGGTYRTTGGTGSWSDDGLFIAQPDGTSMVRFPTDGSPLSLTASDVQIDRASITDLDLSFGSVRSGGQVTLASGVTAPASPPELTTGWQKVTSLEPNDSNLAFDWLGLDYWAEGGGHWVRACNYLGAPGADIDAIELFDAVTGEFERSVVLDINPRAGVTVIGDVAYTLGPDKVERPGAAKNWVHGFDLNTGERVSRWEFTRFDAPNQAKLAIGNDGTNIVVAGAHMDVSRRLYVMRYNPATGAQVGADILSDEWVAYTKNVEAVHISGNSMWVSHVEAVREFTLSGSTPTYTNNGWVNPNKNGAGMVWGESAYGTQVPFVVDGAGSVYEGFLLPSDATVQACFTWFNGTNETTPSPIAVATTPARNSTTFSVPPRDGMQKRVYVKMNTGPWQVTTLAAEQTALTLLDAALGAAAALPTVNTFPAATPAVLKSNIGGFEVKGDGSGHWGPLTFNADGTMTQTAPTWTAITSFAAGFSAHTFGYAPAYRIWPDGKVEWRGVIGGTFNATGGVDPFTLPPATRPAQSVNFQIATQGDAGGRAEFGPTAATTVLRIYTSSSRPFAMLDGCYYYTT